MDRLDFSGSPTHSGCVADVGAGDGGGLIPGDFAVEPAEQLLVDAAMWWGVVSTPGAYCKPIGWQVS